MTGVSMTAQPAGVDASAVRYITFYFDVISPYAYMAFERLPETLKGVSYSVAYTPVLFAGMLKHYGQLGPAEIAPKRDWTYRQVLWLAHSLGIPLQMPTTHPFNPLPLLRLAVACGAEGPNATPNRYVCETILRHVWGEGGEAGDAARYEALQKQLAPARDVNGESVKAQLKSNTEEAIAKGVFGVPAFEVDGKIFWGLDALPMLREYLLGSPWFEGNDWDGVRQVASGITRAR